MADPDILALQADCVRQDVRVSELLRRALLAARLLKDEEFERWVRNELDGYAQEGDVPNYRVFFGQLRAFNPYRGWIPLVFADARMAETLSKRRAWLSIMELEQLADQVASDPGGPLTVMLGPDQQAYLNKVCELPMPMEFRFFLSSVAPACILDAVRQRLMDWTLKAGVGRVSPERQSASAMTQAVFTGPVTAGLLNAGTAIGSNFQVESSLPLDDLRALIEEITRIPWENLPQPSHDELEAELATLRAQVASPKPKRSIVKESLTSIRKIAESAAGSALGQVAGTAAKLLLGLQ